MSFPIIASIEEAPIGSVIITGGCDLSENQEAAIRREMEGNGVTQIYILSATADIPTPKPEDLEPMKTRSNRFSGILFAIAASAGFGANARDEARSISIRRRNEAPVEVTEARLRALTARGGCTPRYSRRRGMKLKQNASQRHRLASAFAAMR